MVPRLLFVPLHFPPWFERIERRSIAPHAIVAQRALADLAVFTAARSRVAVWIADGGPVDVRYARRWQQSFARPDAELLAALVADTEEHHRELTRAATSQLGARHQDVTCREEKRQRSRDRGSRCK
jgi:hypothetical protein